MSKKISANRDVLTQVWLGVRLSRNSMSNPGRKKEAAKKDFVWRIKN